MKKNKSRILKFVYSWMGQIVDPIKAFNAILRYPGFIGDLINYAGMCGSEKMKLLDAQPCLAENTKTAKFDTHYFYQDIWAFKKIIENRIKSHIDIGSRVDFVGFLSAITSITFVDIRPLKANLANFNSIKGDILSLPFGDNSVFSLSCLHVAEHIGLGRYGDSLDPLGTKKACQELSRVLAKGGDLYFSLPIGKPRICFNAHRIHSSEQILQYFNGLKLIEFSGINDEGEFKENIDINTFKESDYACGLFWFKKI